MRIEFQMSESDKAKLLEACKSGPMIALQCGPVMSPQERANIAWGELGKKMGFKAMTVQPRATSALSRTLSIKSCWAKRAW